MSPRIVWPLACVVLVLAAEADRPARAQGVSGAANVSTAKGLALTVDSRWPGGHGYRPVRIEVSSLAPSPADRTLTIELKCQSLYGGTGYLVAGQDIEIPAGAGQVVETIAVPEQFAVGAVELDVAVNGRSSKGLSISNIGPWSNYGQGWEEMTPSILLLQNDRIDTSVLVALFPETINYRQWTAQPTTATTTTNAQYPSAITTAAARLPERFIDYSSLDIVCLSLDEALDLAGRRPAAWTAIRRWTAAGGNLWVYGVGEDWGRLAELERLLDYPPAKADTLDPAVRGWTLPDKKDFSDVARGRENIMGAYQYPAAVATAIAPATTDQPEPQPTVVTTPTPPERPHFVSRRLATGLVVALAPENPFPGTTHQWGWVLNHVGANRFLWTKRHGLSLRSDNASFWDWMIPGVGLAPVGAFRALITVFVLFIGPVNYFWLRRRGKLHLLLLSIPLCAVLVTGSLFGYGIIADGLGVRIRMRSYTEIDQRHGEAICWSRNSYYASLAPSGGLTMPEDVVVLPLEAFPHYQDQYSRVRRSMDWTAEGQKLHSGWLSARTLTQYLLVRSRASDRGLKLVDSSPAGDTWTIENNLGTRVQRLLVIAADGQAFRAADSPDGGPIVLSAADLRTELMDLKQLIESARGVIPAGVSIEDLKAAAGGRWGMRYYPSTQYATDVNSRMGRLESSLVEATAAEPEGNGIPVDSPKPLYIGPRSYVAIVDHSPEAPTGVPAAREEASLHVIVGRW